MKKLFLVFVLLLAATAAVAATSDSSSSRATVTPAIRTYLMPDLSLKSVISLDLCNQLRPWCLNLTT
jgi:predicted benzoate:H+ symporter BenE